MPASREYKPGFQGSRTTGSIVNFYSDGNDPLLTDAKAGVIQCTGRHNLADEEPSVISVSTSKALGSASGSFTAEIRVPQTWGTSKPDFKRRVIDDDWVDIAFTLNGKQYHKMRGQVDTIREKKATSQDGSPSRTYTVTGRDFGRILEMTPIWYNRFRAENSHSEFTINTFQSGGGEEPVIGGNPSLTVKRIIFGFLETLTGLRRANWHIPESLSPNGGSNFIDSLVYEDSDFNPDPARISSSLQFARPDGIPIWSMAQEWADPMFCELYTDLGPSNLSNGKYLDPANEYSIGSTLMTIYFRNKPFPTLKEGKKSLWYNIPVVEVPDQWIQNKDIGRGGFERYNAFFVSPQVLQEGNHLDLNGPLWHPEEITRHGLRPFYVESRYIADAHDLFTMSSVQRNAARDFHCLNPYLYSGSIAFGTLIPQLSIGQRLRITNPNENLEENYYVEQVNHSWSLLGGGRTTAVVTRGWIGIDDDYITALQRMAGQYQTIISENFAKQPLLPSSPPRFSKSPF